MLLTVLHEKLSNAHARPDVQKRPHKSLGCPTTSSPYAVKPAMTYSVSSFDSNNMIFQSPSYELMDIMSKSFESQTSIEDDGCDAVGVFHGRKVTPQSCDRMASTIEAVRHTMSLNTSPSTTDDKLIELIERTNVLIDREAISFPTYIDLNLNSEDIKCRSKMMEWAYRVIQFRGSSDPFNSLTNDEAQRHSIESISIIATAFSYADRLTAKHAKLLKSRAMYKLLCMVCVHLAAKMAGIFNRWSDAAGTSQQQAHGVVPSVQTMLSFRGLSVLSQGEFSEMELSRMELVVLRALDWNLRSFVHDIFEWIDIMVSLLEIEGSNKIDCNVIRERTHGYIQNIIETPRLLKFLPSQLAIAIFMSAFRDHDRQVDAGALLDLVGLCLHKDVVCEIQHEIRMENVDSLL